MEKRIAVLLSILLLSLVTGKSHGDEIENKFKNIAELFAKEFSETVSPVGEQYAASQEERQKTFARQERLFREWSDELGVLIRANPQSIWADDAQYIIATLKIVDPLQEKAELEYLLTNYPNMYIEDWTRKKLEYIFSNFPTEIEVRIKLCFLYKELGEIRKLNNMVEQSIKKFPKQARNFNKFLQ